MEDPLKIRNNSSSFEEDMSKINLLDNLFENNLVFKIEQEKPIIEKSKINLEEIDLNEISDMLNEMDNEIPINIGINYSYNNIKIKSKENHEQECKEILRILNIPYRPYSNKDLRKVNLDTPFKPLLKPKKVNMIGRVFYNISSEDNTNDNSL